MKVALQARHHPVCKSV